MSFRSAVESGLRALSVPSAAVLSFAMAPLRNPVADSTAFLAAFGHRPGPA